MPNDGGDEMKGLMKGIAWLLGIVVVVIIAAAVALPLYFDPNEQKERIVGLVKEQTGRDLQLSGDIRLSVFPWLGLEMEGVTLGNAPGFGEEPFAATREVKVRVQLLPLLRKELRMDTITIEGLELNLVRNDKGRTNWDDLLPKEGAGKAPGKEAAAGKGGQPAGAPPAGLAALALGGIDISDAAVKWEDRKAGVRYRLTKVAVRSGEVAPKKPVDLDLSFDFESSKPALKGHVELGGKVMADLEGKRYSIGGLSLRSSLTGEELPGGKADVELAGNLDLDLKQQTAVVNDMVLRTAGAEVRGRLKAGRILEPVRQLKGSLAVEVKDSATLLGIAGQPELAKTLKALRAEVELDGDTSRLVVQPLDVEATVVPAEKAAPEKVRLSGRLDLDLGRQSADLSGLTVQGLGIEASGNLKAVGIKGKQPRFAGRIQTAPFNLREVLKKLGQKVPETADPKALTRFSVSTDFAGSSNRLGLEKLQAMLDQSTLKGQLAVNGFKQPAVDFTLAIDAIDADRYLPPRKEGAAPPPSPEAAAAGAAAALPVEQLRALRARGELTIGKLKINNLKLKNIRLKVDARDGRIHVPVTAQLYEGSYQGDIHIDATGKVPQLKVATTLKGVQAEPLLTDLTGKARLRGTGDFRADLTTAGSEPGALKRNLNGKMSFIFRNGAIKGFNLGKFLRQIDTFKKTGSLSVAPEEETDFTELTGNPVVKNGVVYLDDLRAKSPAIRIAGKGTLADLPRNLIDYTVEAVVTDTSRGQGGKELERLHGLKVPIRISGPLQDPKIAPDIAGLALKGVQKEVGKQLGKALGVEGAGEASPEEVVKKKLLDVLGGGKESAPAQQTAPAGEPAPAPVDTPASPDQPAPRQAPAAPEKAVKDLLKKLF
ncbi:MAG: AsmA family protein [Gammaproteobacteria bacterium]|nr:MAG: AsmA family protein [Gammaproteobacteria bacterium]